LPDTNTLGDKALGHSSGARPVHIWVCGILNVFRQRRNMWLSELLYKLMFYVYLLIPYAQTGRLYTRSSPSPIKLQAYSATFSPSSSEIQRSHSPTK